jgi:hypothetical protein
MTPIKESIENISRDLLSERFHPGRTGRFMDSSNYRKRVLHKLAEELELPKLTFQVIRRTIATLARKKGDVKDVQGVMRHSRTATTTDVYMQQLPEGVRETVNSIHQELKLGSGTRKAALTGTASGRTRGAWSKPNDRNIDRGDLLKIRATTTERSTASEREEDKNSKPSCRKVLKFAANLLPRGKSGMLLNC